MTATAMRTHNCGALRANHIGQEVRIAGWIHRRRDLGGIVFYDVRDREGLVQVAFGPDWSPAEVIELASGATAECVVLIAGRVAARPEGARNPDVSTGDVEVRATELHVHAHVPPPAIPVWRAKGEPPPSEELRLQHRHLDLRRPELQRNLGLRHRLLQRARRTLSDLGFLEIETPILTKPTPEGARDFLVPSRVHPGQFYALPQSPQLYKQLLMVAGFDRYFQLARCFRDEDLRADRQPEFTQIDIEASFVSAEDVRSIVEAVLVALWEEGGHSVASPFPRMTYHDAMERYGTDKPDLRFKLSIDDLVGQLAGRGFRVFDNEIAKGGRVRGIYAPGGAVLSRREVDEFTGIVKDAGLGGLAVAKRNGDTLSGPLSKIEGVTIETLAMKDGDLLLAVAGRDQVTSPALDRVRSSLISRLGIEPTAAHAFTWVDEFPLFEQEANTGAWAFLHHPFTAPHADDVPRLMERQREGLRALHYDAVYNGHELGSGSIRITDPLVQQQIFDLLGIKPDEVERRFGFLLRALRDGAPPHGGFAIGFDRVAMLLAGATSLREVIAFPKTTAARALFEDAPTSVDPDELASLHIGPRA